MMRKNTGKRRYMGKRGDFHYTLIWGRNIILGVGAMYTPAARKKELIVYGFLSDVRTLMYGTPTTVVASNQPTNIDLMRSVIKSEVPN